MTIEKQQSSSSKEHKDRHNFYSLHIHLVVITDIKEDNVVNTYNYSQAPCHNSY